MRPRRPPTTARTTTAAIRPRSRRPVAAAVVVAANNPPATDLIATMDVNGTPETVAVGAPFPVADPIFRLVSLTARSAKIGLVTGQYSTGSQTVVVKLGKSVTLVSQPDGLRYRITLVRVS